MIELINDDCFNRLAGIKADIVFTSPPYNRKRNDKYSNYDDTIDDYYMFLVTAIETCISIANRYVIYNL